MKKLTKILCAVLVLAMLCSSLMFMVGAAEESAEEDTDAFKPTVEHVTDLELTAVNTYLSGVKYESDDNLINQSSFGNSQTVLALASSKAGDDSYVTFYARKDGTIESQNPFYQMLLDDSKTPALSIKKDTTAYYVIDFDVASHGAMLPYLDISVMLRSPKDTSLFPFSENILLTDYIDDASVWSHVTVVGDMAANKVYLFVNGEYKATAGYAYNVSQTAGADELLPKGMRVDFSISSMTNVFQEGQNTALDNFMQRVYTSADLADGLAKAVKKGDLTAWSGYVSGKAGTDMPAVATVNGAEYNSTAALAKEFITNDTLLVEFLSQPLSPLELCANSTIDTNGMDKDDLFTVIGECQIKSEKDNIVRTTAPFVSNYVETSVSNDSAGAGALSIIQAIRVDREDNLFANDKKTVGRVSTSTADTTPWGEVGSRQSHIVMDTETGEALYKESPNGTVSSTSNDYTNFWFTGTSDVKPFPISAAEGKNQYVVFDVDVAYEGTLDALSFGTYVRKSNAAYGGGTASWGTGVAIKNYISEYNGFVHLTLVYDIDNNATNVFVNGIHAGTVANGVMSSDDHTNIYSKGTSGLYFHGIKMGSNSNYTIYVDNMLARYIVEDEGADRSVAGAIDAKDITVWSDSVYSNDYSDGRFPSIVTVDGVPYYTKADLESALYGNRKTPAVVKVLREFSDDITVITDAKIYTYAQNVTFVDADGNELIPVDGVIDYDAPYISNREDEHVSVVAGKKNDAITDAIKSKTEGNLFNGYYAHSDNAAHWGVDGYRSASLVTNVDTRDVMYREYTVPNADGSVSCAGEYAELRIDATSVTYEEGKSEYLVADFEYAVDAAVTDSISFFLVSSGGSSADIYLKHLGVIPGDTVHITIIYDLTANNAHVFFDERYYSLVEGGAMSADAHTAYLGGTADVSFSEFRIASNGSTSSIYLDNFSVRYFDLNNESDELGAAIESESLRSWSGSVYNAEGYVASKLPPLAIVDGHEYGSAELINKLLTTDTDGVKSVEFLHHSTDVIEVTTDAVVETNNLSVEFDWYTGLYKFYHDDPYQVCTGTDYAYASNKVARLNNAGESVYRFVVLNTDNCEIYATPVLWFNSTDPESLDIEVVFYVFGDEIKPLDKDVYVENGKLYSRTFNELSYTLETGAVVDSFPVAAKDLGEVWYRVDLVGTDAAFAATDIKYGANVSSSIIFKLYVKKSETVTETGTTVLLDNEEYVVFEVNLAPHEINETITVAFEVKDVDGNVYEQRQDINFVEYAASLLAGDEHDNATKAVVASLLNYANEAYALFNGSEKSIEAVDQLLETYASLIPEADTAEKHDTSVLSFAIRSAAMNLNSAPEFVFKIAKGFRGTIQFSYTSLGETVTLDPIVLNAFYGEQIVVLDGLNAYDVYENITITVTEQGSDTPVVGTYNLTTYAEGLGDGNAFALALCSYSKAAENYKSSSAG